jgi:hypothetical protein
MPRQAWGEPDGVPEGSDFTLEAVLTVNGAVAPAVATSSGTFSLTVSDSGLNGGVALLDSVDASAGDIAPATGYVKWTVSHTQSSGWEAGTYGGDIRLVDSAGAITYWPVSLKVRSVKD